MQDSAEGSASVSKQRTGSIGDRPARPTLLEQVLNKKRLVSLVLNSNIEQCLPVTIVNKENQSNKHALHVHIFKFETCFRDMSFQPLCEEYWDD